MEYPWYQTVTTIEDLQQGDFIPDCPVFISQAGLKENDETKMEIQLMDLIILSEYAIWLIKIL